MNSEFQSFLQTISRQKTEQQLQILQFATDFMSGKLSLTAQEQIQLFSQVLETQQEAFAFSFLQFTLSSSAIFNNRHHAPRQKLDYLLRYYLFFPENLTVLHSLLESIPKYPAFTDPWFLLFEYGKLYLTKPKLKAYLNCLASGILFYEQQTTNRAQKLKLRASQLLETVEQILANPFHFQPWYAEENFYLQEFEIAWIQIPEENLPEIQQIHSKAKTILLLNELFEYLGNGIRKPIEFEELTVEEISLPQFLGTEIPSQNPYYEIVNQKNLPFGFVNYLFDHPQYPSLRELPWLPESILELPKDQLRANVFQLISEEWLGVDLSIPSSAVRCWKLSSNTSIWFQRNDTNWFGNLFYVVWNPNQKQLHFILGSITD